MPTNRRKRTREEKKLTVSEIAYLSDDFSVSDDKDYTLWCYRSGQPSFDGDMTPQALWKKYRDDFLPAFIEKNPGKRPLPWWHWDAPKEKVEGWDHERFNSAQRKRLGGVGTPLHEVSVSWGGFFKGIPESWINADYKEAGFDGDAIDPNDPPRFESEAAYLLRHKLLTEDEMKYIKKHPELLKPEIYEDEIE